MRKRATLIIGGVIRFIVLLNMFTLTVMLDQQACV